MISGDGSLVYWSRETSHSSSHHCNDDSISDDESIEVSAVDGRHGHRYHLETIKSSPINRGVYHSIGDGRVGYIYLDINHSSSCNSGFYNFGDDGRCGSMSQ